MNGKKRADLVRTVNPFLRKALKFLHVVFVAAVLGGIVAMVVLVVMKTGRKPDESLFFLDLAVFRIFDGPVTIGFFCIIATSFVFSFFTEWGFIRHWWIIAKWVSLILLFALAWFVLGPVVNGMVSLSDAGYHLTAEKTRYAGYASTALVFSIIFLIILLFLMGVSIYKPWGPAKFANRLRFPVSRNIVFWTIVVLAVVGLFFSAVGSAAMARYRNMKIADTDMKKIRNGRYLGSADVAGYTYKTEVVVRNGKIVSVRALNNRKSFYAYLAEGVFRKVLKYQNANVDAVTGATTTSKALLKSVENALSKAR